MTNRYCDICEYTDFVEAEYQCHICNTSYCKKHYNEYESDMCPLDKEMMKNKE